MRDATESAKAPTDVDQSVSRQVRALRIARGVSQEALANKLGVTFQQLQKYEGGFNRISVGRLALIAQALGVNAATFFNEELDDAAASPGFSSWNVFLKDPHVARLSVVWGDLTPTLRCRLVALAEASAIGASRKAG